MSLGENIYRFRTQKNMSQGELADALEVSRQSVSKWETNGSVPELDKPVALSEVFGITLDELVLDRKPEEPERKVICIEKREGGSAKKVAGIVLLCFAALVWLMLALPGEILDGLVLASPFAACGLICLLTRKNTGLWCAWAVYLFIDIYLRYATGATWQMVFRPRAYTANMTLHLIIAWVLLGIFTVLAAVTAIRLRKALPGSVRGDGIGTAASWGVYLLTWLVFASADRQTGMGFAGHSYEYRFVTSLTGWLRGIAMTAALIFTVRLIISLAERRKRKRTAP